ncbi:hypothetical protein C8F04DRAFT_1251820 [Mycena alexandri]|uniref:AAA-ATPase-like domain-containing protein n=1 Tax=Mycena alexandri TaxID=1745969 RepID=A0AAD6T9K9_9AGAR|nr:hypothetical protein C8F04DRAFT_1251820 [Mycena alexandri]
MSVAEFMRRVSVEHRKRYSENRCSVCPGLMFIKSAWLVHIPDPTAEHLPDPLEQDAAAGVRLMEAAALLSEYVDLNLSDDDKVIRVLFESTFELKANVAESPTKRALEVSQDSAQPIGPESKRLRPLDPTPEGLWIIPPKDPAIPLNLAPPSINFPSLLGQEGIVSIDKSISIPALDSTLETQWACVVTLPKSTGKMFIMSMLYAYYDSTADPEIWEKLFMPLAIGPGIRKAQAQGRVLCSARKHLCLLFDFNNIQCEHVDGKGLGRAIDSYCCAILREFAKKHHIKLGFTTFNEWEKTPLEMIQKIKDTLLKQYRSDPNTQCTLFIAVDHVDFPILRLLAASRAPESITLVTATMVDLITALMSLAGPSNMKVSKMLVNSTLFTFAGRPWDGMKNLSSIPNLQKAYGMTSAEVDSIFSVLSRNRPPTKYLDLSDARVPRFLGRFTPPSFVNHVYTFDLVLQHAATFLKIDSGHKILPDSPLVLSIAERCVPLLADSNLRRKRPVYLSPIREIWPLKLNGLRSKEEILWMVLLCLGILMVTDEGSHRPDQLWALAVRCPTLETQIFGNCPILPKTELEESGRETQMRALFERNPTILMDIMSERLARKHHRDLYQMGEEALQATFDEYMENPELKWKAHYISQLGLLTNSQKTKEARSDEGHLRDAPGEGRFGYSDFFLCGLKRAVVGELKYLSLFGFLRAKYHTKAEFIKKIFEDPTCSFRAHCKKEGKRLRRLPLQKLRGETYFRFENGRGNLVFVGAILDEALKQVECYVKAVVGGIAMQGNPLEGVTRAETRVNVTSGSDEVFGVVFCGVGPRMVTIMADTKSSKYHYAGRPNWRSLYDEDDD